MKTRLLFLFLLVYGIQFAQITDSKNIVATDKKLELLADGYIFTEGPISDKNGNVFFTDQPNNKIIRWDAESGKTSVFTDDSGRSNGLYFDKKGNLIACADMDNQLWQFDKKGKHKVIYEDKVNAHNGPNDLWIDQKNGIYFTDPLYVRNYWKRDSVSKRNGKNVYYVSPDRKKVMAVATDFVQPNGIIGSPDGKFLYASNRAHESITVYAIDAKTGKLTWVDNTPVEGKTPRNFMIDPSDKFLIVANQNSDDIYVFKRNKKTGLLTYTNQMINVGSPVCLKMTPVVN